MGSFRHGVVGSPPRSRKRPHPRPIIIKPELPEENVVVEVIDVEDVDIQDEDEQNVEVIEIEPEAVEEPPKPKMKLKDMTEEQRRVFYKARAEKARATRERNKAIAASQQAQEAPPS